MKVRPIQLADFAFIRGPRVDWRNVFQVDQHEPIRGDHIDTLFRSKDVQEILSTFSARADILASAEDRKSRLTRYKYVSRLASRCTPIGCSVATRLVRFERLDRTAVPADIAFENVQQRVTLDSAALIEFYRKARASAFSGSDEIVLNPSILREVGAVRYYEPAGSLELDAYDISEVEATPELDFVLELLLTGTHTVDAVVEGLAQEFDVPTDEAIEFLRQLSSSGLLIAGAMPSICAEDKVEATSAQVSGRKDLFQPLQELCNVLSNVTTEPQDLRELNRKAREMLDISSTWAIDSHVFDASPLVIDMRVRDKIQSVISKLLPHFHHRELGLTEFTKLFSQKFGEARVPIMEALDPVFGIDIDAIKTNESETVCPSEALLSCWARSLRGGLMSVQLTREDLERNVAAKEIAVGEGVLQVEVLTNDGLNSVVHLQGAMPGSPTRFASRFHHLHPNSEAGHPTGLSDLPTLLDPRDTVYADVLFVGAKRLSNVSSPPPRHAFAVICDDQVLPDRVRPIFLRDLTIGLENDRVVVRHGIGGSEIRPQLNSPMNPRMFSRPALRFLGLLERHNRAAYSFAWPAALHGAEFLPRVTFEGFILSLAHYSLSQSLVAQIKSAGTLEQIRSLLTAASVPRLFRFGESDQLLVYDQMLDVSMECFQRELVAGRKATLSECLFLAADGSTVRKNQLHACHIPYQGAQAERESTPVQAAANKFVYLPGEEWVTLKLYGNLGAFDSALKTMASGFLPMLLQHPELDSWHFLRFSDPEPHLRIRLHAKRDVLWKVLVPWILDETSSMPLRRFWTKSVLEPYVPEVSRYLSGHRVGLCERFFEMDSRQAIAAICSNSGQHPDAVAVTHLDWLMKKFVDSTVVRRDMLRAYSRPFLNRKLSAALFKGVRSSLGVLRDLGSVTPANAWAPEAKNMLSTSEYAEIRSALPSLSHMAVNRVRGLVSRPHESALYDCLARIYDSQAQGASGHPEPMVEHLRT